MKINERYEIRVVVIEIFLDGTTGDVDDNLEHFETKHPASFYKFGFVVFDTEYGYVPDACNDWNDTPEEALLDYKRHCTHPLGRM